MNIKSKKIIKMSAMGLLPLVAISTTMSYAIRNRVEYISINIDGKQQIFENIDKATSYVMSKKIFADREVLLGQPKYLDPNAGIIDPDSLYDVTFDKDHTAPAYKMMNGKYTRFREKALKSYLGRSHLVPQYYDGINFHNGNSIGLKQAKDAIISRQNEAIAPYYDVKLNDTRSIRFNPFNKSDIKSLQKEVFDIYKRDKDPNALNKTNGDHVTSTYLLPTKDGSEIAIFPKDPKKGFQLSDLFNGSLSKNKLSEWLKNKITFDFEVTLKDTENTKDTKDNPYIFKKKSGEFFPESNNNQSIDKNLKPKGIIKDEGKTMSFSNISYKYFEKHKDYFEAFLTYQGFWNHFDEKYNNWLTIKYSTWASAQNDHNVFGAEVDIVNKDPWKHGKYNGWDITINHDFGSFKNYSTEATLTPKIKANEIALNKFKASLIESNSTSIFSKLTKKIQNEILDKFINKNNGGIIDSFKKAFKNKNKNKNKNNKGIMEMDGIFQKEIKHFKSYNYGKDSKKTDEKPEIKPEINDPQKVADCNSELNCLQNNIDTAAGSLNESSADSKITKFDDYFNKNFKKLLLINGTPIDSLGKYTSTQEEPSYANVYENISIKKIDENIIYTFNPNKKIWDEYKLNDKTKDFMKKYTFLSKHDPIKIDSKNFSEFKANPVYNKAIPLLMLNNINKVSNIQMMPIKISKILTDTTGNQSVYKLDKNGFFNNDTDIKNRKKEINEDFFEPALVYVIYNDNDEIIDEFKSTNINLRFDDAETIKHNAWAILSDYIRKDTSVLFIKDKVGDWMDHPISNKVTGVYKIKWMDREYIFKSFENIGNFVENWVKINSRTIVVKG